MVTILLYRRYHFITVVSSGEFEYWMVSCRQISDSRFSARFWFGVRFSLKISDWRSLVKQRARVCSTSSSPWKGVGLVFLRRIYNCDSRIVYFTFFNGFFRFLCCCLRDLNSGFGIGNFAVDSSVLGPSVRGFHYVKSSFLQSLFFPCLFFVFRNSFWRIFRIVYHFIWHCLLHSLRWVDGLIVFASMFLSFFGHGTNFISLKSMIVNLNNFIY